MEIFKFIKNAALLVKGVTQTIETEMKEEKDGFLGMFLCTLSAS